MDTEKVLSGSYDCSLKVWSLKTGECTQTLRGHVDRVLCLKFDQNFVVSGSADKTIKVQYRMMFTARWLLPGNVFAEKFLPQFDPYNVS